ncbi:MAG: AGE family epimerase/isomerase [Bdellovibrionales bacterium]|nr:AGE family epimerase/isomerase [Bdellovibrionales bacterium]
MDEEALELIKWSLNWLKEDVFPLWLSTGFEEHSGSFVESLNANAHPTDMPRRAMVQCRQIYSLNEGVKLNVLERRLAKEVVTQNLDFLLKHYRLENGAFVYSLDASNNDKDTSIELYTQAFVLFGMAQAYELLGDSRCRAIAISLMEYLLSERQSSYGGFTEIKEGKLVYHSNPHMHLFEALLAWIKLDDHPLWQSLAEQIYHLCLSQFFDAKTSCIGEYFDGQWNLSSEGGRFVYEPGHQYEWAWLINEYHTMLGKKPEELWAFKLFAQAEQTGFSGDSIYVIDQVWSDFTPKLTTSRFWPQCERIKAAVALGLKKSALSGKDFLEKEIFTQAADEGMKALLSYLNFPIKGTWRDTRQENGEFDKNFTKSSSLYHIISALSEYSKKRLRI